ncbi:DUF58 domain-containing protein [Frankia sp. CNm7]|uniref:DUF58 domain-containing protein n=1 Tax=Frankia nepalensis TaxID=1836974 RepID=A0A937RBW8_9ACTN|nr:DUF58 domain-containing protein [Frankia nepalensis]MBL7500888.1 DUF58 domain-containing protein [Frankia nepalensis]MBL7509254.1 DUF58 domain-containing protein [Frankia nepalensis]MBL7517287.1 DUF58 domain-containing protein [Frankia nepalensis]MBL7626982.1 DUF58 domain-containing protein [Frankia nepalensis]
MPVPTAVGLGIGLFSLVLGVPAYLLGYREMLVISGSGPAALLLAAIWVVRRPLVTASIDVLPGRVQVGQPAEARIEVRNRSRRPSPRFDIWVTPDRCVRLKLAAAETRAVNIDLPTQRRGVFTVGPVNVLRSDPLGLLRRAQSAGDSTTLTVRPTLLPLPLGVDARRPDTEASEPEPAPSGVSFRDVRDYELGDDVRRIHWPSSLRTDRLVVRLHDDPENSTLMVLLDTHRGSYAGCVDPEAAFEDAVRLAASCVAAASRSGRDCRLVTSAGLTVDSRSVRQFRAVALDALATVETTTENALPYLLTRLAGPPDETLYLVTGDGLPAALQRRLTGARRRYAVLRLGSPHDDVLVLSTRSAIVSATSAGNAVRSWAALERSKRSRR